MNSESKQFKALVQERADLITEGRKIFDGAEASSRGLSAEEQTRDDAINARLAEVASDLKRHEARRERERLAEAQPAYPAPAAPDAPKGGGVSIPRGVRIQVGERTAEKPFLSMGDNLMAAWQLATRHTVPAAYAAHVDYLQDMYAAAGLNEAIGSEGGVLVGTDFVPGILMPLHEKGPFSTKTRNIPVSANANGVVINAVDETSRATGSRWGGVQGYRLAEAQTKTPSKPKFRRMELKLKKYAVLVYATDELLQDVSALESVIKEAAGDELNFMANDDILNGDGVGGPLGIIPSGAAVIVSKETGQVAGSIVNANIINMWARLLPRNRANAAWYINAGVEGQLSQLTIPAGVGAVEPRYITYGPDGVLRIMGKPVIVTEFSAAAGTRGDIMLADLGDYVTIDKGGVQYATSIHVEFLTDQTAFRFVYRYDGQPSTLSPITPYKGTATQGAYVILDTRA